MKNLEPHQYRLLNERIELRDRVEKLLVEAKDCLVRAKLG